MMNAALGPFADVLLRKPALLRHLPALSEITILIRLILIRLESPGCVFSGGLSTGKRTSFYVVHGYPFKGGVLLVRLLDFLLHQTIMWLQLRPSPF